MENRWIFRLHPNPRILNVCGRFDRHSTLTEFTHTVDSLHVEASEELPPSYNVAPSQRALVVRNTPGGRVASALVWGLMPSWVKDVKKYRPINARNPWAMDRYYRFCQCWDNEMISAAARRPVSAAPWQVEN